MAIEWKNEYGSSEFPVIPKTDLLFTDITDIPDDVKLDEFITKATIIDANYADWAIRRVLQLRSQHEYIDKLYKIQKAQLDDYRHTEQIRIAANEKFWTERLSEYFEQLKEEGIISQKDKGFSLPHGRLQTRKQKDTWDFSQVDAEYLGSIDPSMVKVVIEIDEKTAKEKLIHVNGKVIYTPTGQVVEGITVTSGVVRFYVDHLKWGGIPTE